MQKRKTRDNDIMPIPKIIKKKLKKALREDKKLLQEKKELSNMLNVAPNTSYPNTTIEEFCYLEDDFITIDYEKIE
jgi:hypothetical protein